MWHNNFVLLTVALSLTSQPKPLHTSIPASVLVTSTPSPLDTHSMTSAPTAVLSVAISSPPHTGNGGGSSDKLSIDSLSIGVGVSAALLVLTIASVIIIAVLVCLRKRRNNKLKTTENVAYLYIRTISQTNKDGLNPYMSTSSNKVYSGHTSSNEITGICSPLYTNHAYLKVSSIGPISNTAIITSTNQANFEDGPIYDIPESTDQSYLKEEPCQNGSYTLTDDCMFT